jgi:catechol 2,3-dioxygenase-like lactoylglutathione lyase family enzyme
MIGYITLGTQDLQRAAAFYDELLGLLGMTRQMAWPTGICWGRSKEDVMFAVCTPFNGEAASAGNGTMVALMAPNEATIQAVHAKALALGGTCDGPPGPRGDGFYAAYFRDLDGNKLNAFMMNG